MRKLQLLSVAHDNVPKGKKFSSYCLEAKEISSLKKYLDRHQNVWGYVCILTCNRQEIYIETDLDILESLKTEWTRLLGKTNPGNETVFRSLDGTDAVSGYLMELAFGFRSAIKGDDQILNQIKKAFQQSSQDQRLSTLLERCFQYIMRCNKEVVNDTDLKTHSVSLAFHALKRANGLTPTPSGNKSVLIMGAGQMAEQIVKYLEKFPFRDIAITNRTRNKAEKIAAGKPISVLDYADLDNYIDDYAIIINCINGTILTNVMNKHSDFSKLRTIVDIALPEVVFKPGKDIKILNLDTLIKELDSNNEKRESSIPLVEKIIGKYKKEFCDWTDNYNLRKYGERVMAVG